MEQIGLQFQVDRWDQPETEYLNLKPEQLVATLSLEKAWNISQKYPEALIIAADTIGVLRGKIVGKPHTPEEACKILHMLNGRSHRVITGLAILDSASKRTVTRIEETRVFIKRLSSAEIEKYVETGEPLDKAGAYAIQGLGSIIVEKIIGDYYNVVGLPLNALAECLKEFGVKVL